MERENYPEPLDSKSVREKIEDKLGLSRGKLSKYLKSGAVKFIEDYPPYIRFRRPLEKLEKGTNVFFNDKNNEEVEIEVVRGYPKTGRLLMVEKGIKKYFNSPFHVEEKLNGYNVRLAKVFGEIKALTRGGLECPYTNEVLDKSKYTGFFRENPNLMLCGEVIGQNNPYVEKKYPEEKDFGFYIFDVRNKDTCKSKNISEKKKLLEKHEMKKVKELGIFDPNEGRKVLKIVEEMGKEGREGVVLKSSDMSKQAKYTANESTNKEMGYAFKFWSDYGKDFMFRRIVREAFQAHEKKLKGKSLEKEAKELGKSILLPFVKTIREIEKGNKVTEDFTLNVPTKEFGKAYVKYLKNIGIDVEIKKVRKVQGYVEIDVARKYPSTNDKTQHYLDGNIAQE